MKDRYCVRLSLAEILQNCTEAAATCQRENVFFVFVVVNCIAFCISRSILFVFFVTFVTFSKYCKLHGASGNILGEECFYILYFSVQFVLHCQNIANYTGAAATC